MARDVAPCWLTKSVCRVWHRRRPVCATDLCAGVRRLYSHGRNPQLTGAGSPYRIPPDGFIVETRRKPSESRAIRFCPTVIDCRYIGESSAVLKFYSAASWMPSPASSMSWPNPCIVLQLAPTNIKSAHTIIKSSLFVIVFMMVSCLVVSVYFLSRFPVESECFSATSTAARYSWMLFSTASRLSPVRF